MCTPSFSFFLGVVLEFMTKYARGGRKSTYNYHNQVVLESAGRRRVCHEDSSPRQTESTVSEGFAAKGRHDSNIASERELMFGSTLSTTWLYFVGGGRPSSRIAPKRHPMSFCEGIAHSPVAIDLTHVPPSAKPYP